MIKKYKLFLESIADSDNVVEVNIAEFWDEFKTNSIHINDDDCDKIISGFSKYHILNRDDDDGGDIVHMLNFDIGNDPGRYEMFFDSDYYLWVRYEFDFYYEPCELYHKIDISDGYNYISDYMQLLDKTKVMLEEEYKLMGEDDN